MPPEPTTSAAGRWTPRAARRHGRRLVAPLAGSAALILLAAWAVPPLLDWGRFRTQIAAIAAARLGRPVAIGGDITLRLLPQAVLTASDVTLGESGGDGITVQVSALRLQVATVALIAGQLRLRDLVLSAPVLRLPLILPEGIAHPSRPQLPHAFAARIENGTLRLGQTEVTGITASIHGGPALASVQETLTPNPIPVAAFGAEGFARAAGRVWRFTGALGAPDADGVSAIDISVRGQAEAGNTGGAVQATLADGVIQGRLRAGGPDLSLLMPASALAWHADAPFVASADHIEATAIALSLGGAPAEGTLTLQTNAPARIEGRLHAATLDLDGWAGLLGKTFGAQGTSAQPSHLPRLQIALDAGQARLLGGTLHDLHATLVSDGHGIGFDRAQATLPGGAVLSTPRARFTDTDAHGVPTPLALSGAVSLDAPDLRATLAWLHPLMPATIDALPGGVLASANLSGEAALRRSGLGVAGLIGQLDGSAASGGFSVRLGPSPHLTATLTLAELALDPWLAGLDARAGLASIAAHLTASDTDLHIHAAKARWHGLAFDHAAFEANTGAGGLHIASLTAALAGADLSLTGDLAPDGRLLGTRASLAAPDLARLLPLLPDGWRWAPGLFHGPAAVALAAEGPPAALALQLRADASDLVLETEATRDTTAGTGTATLTLRHPGAPRLLATLGLPGGLEAAVAWLDTGSLTLRTHLQSRPGHLTVQDFDLDAAALRAGGHLDANWTGAAPSLTGTIDAEQLALPAAWPTPDQAGSWGNWTTQLHIAARDVTIGMRPVAHALSADVTTAGAEILADAASADIAGGHATGAIAADFATQAIAAHVAVTGARFDRKLTLWPVDAEAGGFDITADVFSAHDSWATLSGEASAVMRDLRVTGFDLAALGRAAALPARAARAMVQTSLSQGASAGLFGTLNATVAQGRVTIATPARLISRDGAIALNGGADLAHDKVDLTLALQPASHAPPPFYLRLKGPFQSAKATTDRQKR